MEATDRRGEGGDQGDLRGEAGKVLQTTGGERVKNHTKSNMKKSNGTIYQLPLIHNNQEHCPICREILRTNSAPVYIFNKDCTTKRSRFIHSLKYCSVCDVFYGTPKEVGLIPHIEDGMHVESFSITKYSILSAVEVRKREYDEKLGGEKIEKKQTSDICYTYTGINHENQFQKNNTNEQVNVDYVTVYSIKSICLSCRSKGLSMNMTSGTLIVFAERGMKVGINVERCNHCGHFYIDEESLRMYEKRYGVVLLERRNEIESKTCYGTVGYDNYQEDTILSRCSYKADGTQSIETRRAIIRFILDSGKSNKGELKTILNTFIRLRGERCHKAVFIWKDDVEYINDYNINEQSRYYNLVFKYRQPRWE